MDSRRLAKHSRQPTTVTRDAVLEHLGAHPGATKRDLAKALGVHGADRIQLKRILAQLAEEGLLERGKKKSYLPPGALPEIGVLEITGTDTDGELLARQANWDGDDEPPAIILVPGRDDDASTRALGIGERVLARIERGQDGYEGRVIKRLGTSVHRALGVLRKDDAGRWRVEPVDRKTRYAFQIDDRDRNDAQPGELVMIEPRSGHAHSPRGRIVERLGSMDEPKTVSLIAIHAHGIPTEFPREAIHEAEAAKPVALGGRTDLRAIPLVTIDPDDARDHDDAVWAGPDGDPNNRGGHIVIVAIAEIGRAHV